MGNNCKKKQEKTINKGLYYTLMPVLIGLSKLIIGVKTDKSALKGVDGPYLIIGNHTSPIDFLYFTAGVYPEPVNFVVAENMIYRRVYGRFISSYGTIKKKQFTADFSCIKQIKKNIDAGTHVLLFPEGRVSIDGTTGYIAPSIGKLIKFLGCTVVAGVTHGGYTGTPKWGKMRRTKVTLKLKPILSKKEIKELSAGAIANIVTNSLRFDDNRYLVEEKRKITRCARRAKGLEKILYKCPNCGAEFKNITHGNVMKCTACGNEIKYGRDGILHLINGKTFDFISDWYAFERDDIKKQVADENFELSGKVDLYINNEKLKKFNKVGHGVLSVSKDGINYKGEDGEYKTLRFKIENRDTIAFRMGVNLEVSEDDNIYRFAFTEGLYSTKFVLAIEELHKVIFRERTKINA